MYLLYSLILALGFVLALPWFWWKDRSSGKYSRSFRERMGRLPASLTTGDRPSIWIHAVSVGEVLAARTLVEPLKQRLPGHAVFVSTTTLTGQAVARQALRGVDGLFFAPFDWPLPVRRALDRLRPSLLLLIETEIWPNLIHEARRRGTRVAVVNGRISPRSFARYRRIRAFLRPVLAEVDIFLMQEPSHVRRIVEMGAPAARVRALGNLKFDALEPARTPDDLGRLFADGHAGPTWVAGSTAPGEEELVLRALQQVREAVPHTRLVLAPRHPERFGAVPALVEAAGFRCARRSISEPGWDGAEVLLLDTLGELAGIYPVATAVFVGGSLVPAGGHNVLEAAVAGRAIVVGPHMENFQEIADRFRDEGGMIQIAAAEDLAPEIIRLLTDVARRERLGRRAQELVEASRGALRETLDALVALAGEA